MKILVCGTALSFMDQSFGNLAGFNHGYQAGFEALGHKVDSISHSQILTWSGTGYDFFLLRDTTVNLDGVLKIKKRCKHFALFTHAEWIQGRREWEWINKVDPEHIFLDQPKVVPVFEGVRAPKTFLGFGANLATHRRPWEEKDIDVLWVGHDYGERQPRVKNLIWPLQKLDASVKIHGRGQPDGPLSMIEMFDAMSRAKIVVHLCHKAHWEGGYGGRTVFDALASGAVVVHDKYAMDKEVFPFGVIFADIEDVSVRTKEVLGNPLAIREMAKVGYGWVKQNKMISHVAQEMLDIVIGGKE